MLPRLPTGRRFARAYNAAHDTYKARLRRAGLVPGQHFDPEPAEISSNFEQTPNNPESDAQS